MGICFRPQWAHGQEQSRPIVVAHDRNGRTAADATPGHVLAGLRAGDRVSIVLYPGSVFDFGGLDVPRRNTLQSKIGSEARPFFVYPEDPYLLFDQPKTMISTIPPGPTDFYIVGAGRYRLRMQRLTQAQLDTAIPADNAAAYNNFYKKRMNRCYALNDPTLFGRMDQVQGPPADSLIQRIGWNPRSANTRRLYAFRGVTLPADEERPYAALEIVQNQASKDGCDPTSAQALPNTGGVAQTIGLAVVRVAPDFDVAKVVYRARINGEDRQITGDLVPSATSSGAMTFTTEALDQGSLNYRICYNVAETSGLKRFIGSQSEWCIPLREVTASVASPLPGAVRLQPGMIAVNRGRDVRLTANVLMIVDRASYFRTREHPRLLGGYVNPIAGLQFGGAEGQVVMLAGVHLRLLNEAGMVVGFRFGNQNSSTPLRADQNLFVGFSFDPGVLATLRSARQP
jgi:hypothetical protein